MPSRNGKRLGSLFCFLPIDRMLGLGQQHGLGPIANRVRGDDALAHIFASGDFVHHVEQKRFDDRAQAACACAKAQGLFRRRLKRILAKNQLDVVQRKETLILFDDRILWLG